ncbi:solute carrier family 35 member F5 isoform X2 [Schistocerca serialis cubense]|uniref:solute carrier family 35 member F5 isoform X2 n=1 Tax=Schistocerca serialis cubense TaxID=2023355 RepID=UPI00214F013F|nr:solute carrier family 35 member F5 isoform X2 [Schistocerca serialis cubense]
MQLCSQREENCELLRTLWTRMSLVVRLIDVGASFSGMLNKSQRLLLGLFVLLLVDIIWVSSSELTKYIYHNAEFEKPFFSTYVKTSMFTLYLLGLCIWPPWRNQCSKPATYMYIDPNVEDENFYSEANTSLVRHMSETDATEALLARLSYQASVRAGEAARRAASKLPLQRVAKVALMFCLLWFLANYTYQVSLAETEAGMVAVLSSTSSLFTLILAALFPSNLGDRFTLSKLVAVTISITGLVVVSLSDLSLEPKLPTGAILALVSAFFYAMYLVFLRRKVDHEDKMDIPIFFGFVGLFNLLFLWPLFFLFHYCHWELFEWPSKPQWTFLLINGLIGTVLSEVLWLWGCFLTSSLIATVAISLTIPMTMLADVVMKRVHYPYTFYLGTVPMFVAFCAVALLAHYDNWDPVLDGAKRCHAIVCKRTRSRTTDCEDEQTESLIGINSADHEA